MPSPWLRRELREQRSEQMAEPTTKSQGITDFLESLYGRTSSIAADHCVRAPIGCGGEATNFRDERSRKEYRISGLCQKCQDLVWPNIEG
jgi:hypothetical protein